MKSWMMARQKAALPCWRETLSLLYTAYNSAKGQGPEPHTRPSTSGQSIGAGYVHRMKRHRGAVPHVGEFAACVCVMFACIARVMAVRWKMRCRREHGRLASETATALLQSQPCEQIDTQGPDGAVRCKTSHQRRKHAMHPVLLLGADATKLPMFANRLRNAYAPGTWDACHRARQGRSTNEFSEPGIPAQRSDKQKISL